MAEQNYVTFEEFEHHFNLIKDANIMAMKFLVTALAHQVDATRLRTTLLGYIENLKTPSHPQLIDLIKIIVEELAEGAGHAEAMKLRIAKGSDARN